MRKNQMGKRGYARKRDENEPGIIAALELAGATVVSLDKPLDLLVGFDSDTELMEVKNGNQPPSWQRVTDDQADFFKNWKGKRATIVSTMRQALAVLHLDAADVEKMLRELSATYDDAGVPLAQKK